MLLPTTLIEFLNTTVFVEAGRLPSIMKLWPAATLPLGTDVFAPGAAFPVPTPPV